MDAPPFVSADDLAATTQSVLALIHWQARQIQRLAARVADLEAEVAELKARLNKESAHS
jgi:cell division protein FtsB